MTKERKKIKIKIAIMGEKSIGTPLIGINLLMGCMIGAVVRRRNWTMGLYGSGFTQEIRALIIMSQIRIVTAIFKMVATTPIKVARTNIMPPFGRS